MRKIFKKHGKIYKTPAGVYETRVSFFNDTYLYNGKEQDTLYLLQAPSRTELSQLLGLLKSGEVDVVINENKVIEKITPIEEDGEQFRREDIELFRKCLEDATQLLTKPTDEATYTLASVEIARSFFKVRATPWYYRAKREDVEG